MARFQGYCRDQETLDRLPAGIILDLEKYTEPGAGPYTGLVATGDSFSKKNSTTLNVKFIFDFNSQGNATSTEQAIADMIDKESMNRSRHGWTANS